jgi:hypothetical protein
MNPQYGTLVVTIGGEPAHEGIPCIPATTTLTIDPHEVHISRPGCPGISWEKEVLERVVISFTDIHEFDDVSLDDLRPCSSSPIH